MTNQRNWRGWILGVGGMFVVAAGGAAAQMTIFSSALDSPLSGQPGDALPILVLADVGSWAGPPDNILDLITADTSSRTKPNGQTLVGFATVWFGNGHCSSSTSIPCATKDDCPGGESCVGDGTFTNSNLGTPLGRIPSALAVGDFDGDQIPDLAITDTTSGNLVLLHGYGEGTFSQPGPAVLAGGRCSSSTTIACTKKEDCPSGQTCNAAPVALTAAHVNNDDAKDLIVVNNTQSAGWVTALLGDGQGGFTPTNPIDLGPGGSAVGIGYHSSGNLDFIAVANRNTNSVVILRGDGQGNLSLSQTISEDPNGREPVAIAVGDLNNDGRDDLVAVNHVTDNIGVFLAQADGMLELQGLIDSGTMNSAPNGVALFDANGDDRLDVAVSNNFSFDVSVLLGDGTGNFGAPRAFVTNQEPLTVAAGDLNGDGIPDLVALNRDNSTPDAVVLLGQGDGTFKGVENVIVEPTPNAVIAGDTDNDGLPDLIVAHPTGTVLVRRAQPGGGFGAPLTLQAAGDAFAIGCGDFNADGRLDIVALNRSTSNVSMFLGQRNGFPSTPQNYPIGAGGVALAVGDWDGNGRPDLAVARQGADSSGAIDILLSNADGSLQEKPPSVALGANPVAIEWGDFNNDRKLDLAFVSNGSNVTILLGNGNGTFQPAIDIPIAGAGNDAKALAVADFDGDGSDDIAVLLAPPDNRVVVLYGNGQAAFTLVARLTFASPAWSLTARDISGDLIPDLVVSVQGDTNAVIPFVSGGSSRLFGQGPSAPVSRGPTSIIAADFDGDGRYDAATADNNVAGSVSVLTNIEATPVIRGDGNGDGKVTAADLVAVARKLRDGAATRVEQTANGSYPAAPGADANGDGLVTSQDARALAHRLFPRI